MAKNMDTSDVEKRVCKDCGAEFFISNRDKEFFKEKGFPLPKRCYNCRQKRKAMRGADRD